MRSTIIMSLAVSLNFISHFHAKFPHYDPPKEASSFYVKMTFVFNVTVNPGSFG